MLDASHCLPSTEVLGSPFSACEVPNGKGRTARSHKSHAAVNYTPIGVEPHEPSKIILRFILHFVCSG